MLVGSRPSPAACRMASSSVLDAVKEYCAAVLSLGQQLDGLVTSVCVCCSVGVDDGCSAVEWQDDGGDHECCHD